METPHDPSPCCLSHGPRRAGDAAGRGGGRILRPLPASSAGRTRSSRSSTWGRSRWPTSSCPPRSSTGPSRAYALTVGFCPDCTHVQLTEHVPPPDMFEDYLYVSSASDTLQGPPVGPERRGGRALRARRGRSGDRHRRQRRHAAQGLPPPRVQALGVDPARTWRSSIAIPGSPRYTGFFDSRSAVEILEQYRPASAITATNTFPHIPELQDFVRGIDIALAPGGSFVIEAHYLMDIFEQLRLRHRLPRARLLLGAGPDDAPVRGPRHAGHPRRAPAAPPRPAAGARAAQGRGHRGRRACRRCCDAERAAGLDQLET